MGLRVWDPWLDLGFRVEGSGVTISADSYSPCRQGKQGEKCFDVLALPSSTRPPATVRTWPDGVMHLTARFLVSATKIFPSWSHTMLDGWLNRACQKCTGQSIIGRLLETPHPPLPVAFRTQSRICVKIYWCADPPIHGLE